MRVLVQIVLCGVLTSGMMLAQRGGMGGGGGSHGGMGGGGGMRGGMGGGSGMRGGGFGGGGFRGGNFGGGGFHGGSGGFRNGFGGFHNGFGGFRGGFGGFRGGFGGFYGGYWPYWGYPAFGFGYSYSPGYYGGWDYPYDDYYYSSPYYSYPGYYGQTAAYSQPGVSIVYPPAQSNTVYVERARPVMHEYDQYGQEVAPSQGTASATASSSPVYLIAFKDKVIRAASSYWVDGNTLHYVTLQHEERQASLDSVDREFSLQLNRERRVAFQLGR